MAQIFISYRRHDSGYLAGDLNDKLQEHFGPNSVFFDIDNIPLGVDFRKYIGDAVGQCDVLLVIIGDEWVGPTNSDGKRRIDDPADFVRIEIESALKRNIPVIPVLVGEATMKSMAHLPPSLESIAYRNATEIRAGRDRRQHIEQLIEGLEKLFATHPPPPTPASPDEKSTTLDAKNPSVEGTASGRVMAEDFAEDLKQKLATARKVGQRLGKEPAGKAPQETELLEGIQQTLKDCTDSHLYVGTAIPSDKLANAISAYAPGVSPKDVLLFFDNTVFGGAKDGFLLTGDAVYWHNVSAKPAHLNYEDIQAVLFRDSGGIFNAAKILINQEEIEFHMGDKNKLAEVLANVIRYLTDRVKG